MEYEITLPSLGDENDAVQGATVSAWLAPVGATLKAGDDLVEVITDKAAFVVPCPQSGVVKAHAVSEGATVAVGQTLAVLEA